MMEKDKIALFVIGSLSCIAAFVCAGNIFVALFGEPLVRTNADDVRAVLVACVSGIAALTLVRMHMSGRCSEKVQSLIEMVCAYLALNTVWNIGVVVFATPAQIVMENPALASFLKAFLYCVVTVAMVGSWRSVRAVSRTA